MQTASPRSKIRVLIVDDSAFMRSAIARLLSSDSRFEVVGLARDGSEGVELAAALTPDVVTMDFNMPGLDGVQTTRAILASNAIPIVMLSAHTQQGATQTMQALAAGAVDFVGKPAGEVSVTLNAIRDELILKLVAAATANVQPVFQNMIESITESHAARARDNRAGVRAMPAGMRLIVIASSTGGPAALVRVLSTLELLDNASVLMVQHMPAGFTTALAAQLAEYAAFPVREAKAGDRLVPGLGLVAPGGSHLLVQQGGLISLNDGPSVHGFRPAADVTLKSVAHAFGARSVGVVLTGMGRDGALGLAAIKAAGGRTAAQDKPSSTVYGMPRAAVELGVVEEVVPLERMGSFLSKLIG